MPNPGNAAAADASDIDLVRDRNPLAEVVAECVDMKRNGRRSIARCPLPGHDDDTPSFTVYQNQSWYCFGCCRGGDVFSFVMANRGVDFPSALRILADRGGIRLGRKVPEPDQGIAVELERAIDAAARRLTDQHREYLRGRGLLDETIAHLRIGTGPSGEVWLPVLKYGQPTYLIKHYPDASKGRRYLFPKKESGGPKPIIGSELLRSKETLYVTEGFFDWAVLTQADFCAVALLGVAKADDFERLSHVEELCLMLDGDDEGRRAADTLAAALYPNAKIIRLPDGTDPNSLAVDFGQGFGAEVKRLTGEARDALDIRLEALDKGVGAPVPILSEVTTLLAHLSGFALDLAVDRISGSVKPLGIRKETIRTEVEAAKSCITHIALKAAAEPNRPDPEIVASADKLLRTPNILAEMLSTTERLGHQGEEINRQMVFLAGIAGHTAETHEDSIHLVIHGASASGKNVLARLVLALFPRGRVRFLTGVSQQALVYQGGRIEGVLVFQEAEGEEHAEYSIRQAMSEGWLERMTVMDGEAVTVRTYVVGSIITTTTELALHDENQTRVFDLHADESPELTRKILHAEGKRAAGARISDTERARILSVWHTALAKLEPVEVVIPYASALAERFPSHPLRVRRDVRRTNNLIAASARLYQWQRHRDEEGRLVASIEDYAMTRPLIEAVLGPSMTGLTEKAEGLIKLHGELAERTSDGWVDRIQLQKAAEAAGLATDKTVRKWCQRLTDMGIWEAQRVEGRKWQHRALRDVNASPIGLPTPEELARAVQTGNSGDARQNLNANAASDQGGSPGTAEGDGDKEEIADDWPAKADALATSSTGNPESDAASDAAPGRAPITTADQVDLFEQNESPEPEMTDGQVDPTREVLIV